MSHLTKPATSRKPLKGRGKILGGCCFKPVAVCHNEDGLYTTVFLFTTHLKWIEQRALKHDHIMILVDAFPLTGTAQVIVWTDCAFESGTHNRPVTAITDHIRMHHAWRSLLAAGLAVKVFTFKFLFL